MNGRDLIWALALAVALFVMVPAIAVAQIIQIDPLSGGLPPSFTDDGVDLPLFTTPERRGRDGEPAVSMEMPEQTVAGLRLVPLRMSTPRADGLQTARLSGEVARERFILFLPASPGAVELRIFNRSGIDLLPEASTLRVTVNGTVVGDIVPDSFTAFAEDRVMVPEGVLNEGRNLVEVEARQTHRIACGPDASFALWTEIDASISGVPMAASAFNTDALGFLSAIAAQTALGQAVEIRRPDPEAPLIDAAPFIGQVAAALGGTAPAIQSTSYWPLAGTMQSLARITAFPVGEGPPQPRFERGGDGAIVLLLERGSNYAEISGTLLAAANGQEESGVQTLTAGLAQPLSSLRPRSLTGEGHYIFMDVPFQLPWDWLLLSSQKARLDLRYRFAAGLPEGALMLVKINGTTVRLLPLDVGAGTDLPTLPISFGASLLRPGINQLAFEVLVPGDTVGRACPPSTVPVFEIADTSQLFVPGSPRMLIPSINRSLANLSLDDIRMTETAAAILPPGFLPQVAAALAASQTERLAYSEAGSLIIGTLFDLETMYSDWLADGLATLRRALTEGRPRDPEGTPDAQPSTWDAVTVAGDADGLPSGGLADFPRRTLSSLRRMALGDAETLETWLSDRAALAALIQPDADRPGDVWLILGPQAVPDDIARSLAASRNMVGGPSGQVAIFTADRAWESWTAPNRPLRLHETLSFGNLRNVLGNYASHQPLGFLAVIFGFTILSAAAGLLLLLLTRRSRT